MLFYFVGGLGGHLHFFGYICKVRDYYDTLGIPPSASRLEIQQAFQRLSLKFHPDRNAHDPFFTLHYNRVKEAYEILSDDHKRYRYDKAFQAQNNGLEASLMDVSPPVIASFFASKKASQRGDALTISWEVINADLVRINLIGEVASNGTQTIRLTEVTSYHPYINIDLEATNEASPTPVKQRWQLKNLSYDGSPVPELAEAEDAPTLQVVEEPLVEAPKVVLVDASPSMTAETTRSKTSTQKKLAKRPSNQSSHLLAYGIIIVLFFLIIVMLYTLLNINPIF